MTFSIISNFRIDSQERLTRLKDSFLSFKQASIDKWIINARGPMGEEALEFLREYLGERLVEYKIETDIGWLHDTRVMLDSIETDYVLYWIEDQICMCGPDRLNEVVSEMKKSDVDYMGYSWFGLGTFTSEFLGLPHKALSCILVVDYDKRAHRTRIANSVKLIGVQSYIISLPGIFSKELFSQLLQERKFFLRRWPKVTPFDFERTSNDTGVLPLKYGVPKFEIFCTIDDDNQVPGSSLISRGLYPERLSRDELLKVRNDELKKKSFQFLRNTLRHNLLTQKIYRFLCRVSYHF